ncbi:hypothetical protein AKJ09_07651 [Labilithrix luteola]|uniref:Uncharacterized protein n=1 Tax=Labilithrix luteola TaxID=1391654 RepID=A0A0K1Q5H6_9BACT|nr:hypothetical protein AKJ09_07651 [Labilithrix luteola]
MKTHEAPSPRPSQPRALLNAFAILPTVPARASLASPLDAALVSLVFVRNGHSEIRRVRERP